MADSGDVVMGGVADSKVKEEVPEGPTTLQLSALESQILELYDRMKELELDIALAKAQEAHYSILPSSDVTDEHIEAEQKLLLNAKARYSLKQRVIENVLIAPPILKAVHTSSTSTPLERDLTPLIQLRDSVAIQLTSTHEMISSTHNRLTDLEVSHVKTAKKNRELAEKMMALAEEAGRKESKDVKDEDMRARIEEEERKVQVQRGRWRLMRETAAAVVTGSGVDWVREEGLRELVLDEGSGEE